MNKFFIIIVVIAAVFSSCQKPNHSTLRPQLQEMADSLLLGYEGCVVAIEPATGKVLVMANSTNDTLNIGTHGLYSPGNSVKMLIPLICLQNGDITDGSEFTCQGIFSMPIVCTHNHGSVVSVSNAIENQCNPAIYQCAKAFLEPDSAYENNHAIFHQRFELMSEYLRSLGLGVQYEESDIPHASGNIPSSSFYDRVYGAAGWKAITIRSNFIGQGEMLATPLQLANLAATIANEGWYIAPHLSSDKSSPVHQSLIDKKWFNQYKMCMSEMVTYGEHFQLFVGFTPVENPKIAIAIVVRESASSTLNVKQIAEEIYNKI